MSQLQDNLKLCLQAVKYAKENVKRSANQHYFKSGSPFQQNKRNDFLLGATRGGSYQTMVYDDGSFAEYERDDLMAQRRKELAQLIAMPMDKKEKQKKIDRLMKAWGSQYFWGGTGLMSGGENQPSRWQQKTWDEQAAKIAKKLNMTVKQVKDLFEGNDQAQIDFVMNVFVTKVSADNAKKFGVGNCQEKGENAILYLLDHTPGGQRICLYCLEEKHKGVTGLITGSGGDHVFGVYGNDAVTDNIGSLGPNAIIVDGWMNDAYPAQYYLTPKHGLNYNNERINIKQFTVRNMVCVSYRSHVQCMRDFGTPGAGPGIIPVPTLLRKSF